MQTTEFIISHWAACSPHFGIVMQGEAAKATDWEQEIPQWKPDISFLPKLMGRKLSRLSKMALCASHYALEEKPPQPELGVVFCSRYGEYANTYEVLQSIQEKALISPLAFSQSVHNTAQGVFSVVGKHTGLETALCGKRDLIENAFIKACGMLSQGSKEVLVLYHEDLLPEIYTPVTESNSKPMALACVIRQKGPGIPCQLSFAVAKEKATGSVGSNEHAIALLELLQQGEGELLLHAERLLWRYLIARRRN